MRFFLALVLLFIMSSPALAQIPPMGDNTGLFDKVLYQNTGKTVKFEYYLLGPKKIEDTAKYPLIVVLPARNGEAYGAKVLADQIVKQGMPAFVAVPVISPRLDVWTEPSWRDVDKAMPRPIDHVAAITKAIMAKLPIDRSRVYVTGYAMGGAGTYGALADYPDIFAAGIPICAPADLKDVKKLAGKPLWIFHGKADSVTPVKETEDMVEAIRAAGGRPQVTLYKDVEHNSWIEAYAEPELWTWLFAQTNSKAQAAVASKPAPAKTETPKAAKKSVIKHAEPAGTRARQMP